jgi:putative ABC transport system permease protein
MQRADGGAQMSDRRILSSLGGSIYYMSSMNVRPGRRLPPLWRRTPLVLVRFPTLFGAVAAAAVLLTLASISGTLFLAATQNAALNSAIEELDRFSAGFFIAQPGPLVTGERRTAALRARDEILRDTFRPIAHVGPRVLSVYGNPIFAAMPGDPASPSSEVRLLARTDALAHVTVLEEAGDEGVWISDLTAETLGVSPGDRVALTGDSPGGATVRVAGIYRALVNEATRAFWSPMYTVIFPEDPDVPRPQLVLANEADVFSLSRRLGERSSTVQWDFPIAGTALTLSEARTLERQFGDIQAALGDPGTRLSRFTCFLCARYGQSSSGFHLDTAISKATDTVAGLRAPVDLLSVAGSTVALAVVAAAGAYSVHRRRSETLLLSARGMGPPLIGLKTAVESAVPIAAGVLLGYVSARVLTGWLAARGIPIEGEVLASAARTAAVIAPVAAITIGSAAAVTGARESKPVTSRASTAGPLWEVVALLACVPLYRLVQQEGGLVSAGSSGVPRTSYLLLLFPVLFIGGASGLVTRGFGAVVRRIAGRSEHIKAPLYLGVHRLAGAKRLGVLLVAACGLAAGIFVYGQTMATSLEATTRAKAYVFTGSDATTPVDDIYEPPADFPFASTSVSYVVNQTTLGAGDAPVYILAVQPSEIADVAFWDKSFGASSLSNLMERIGSARGGGIRAVAVGPVPSSAAVDISGTAIAVTVASRVSSFPGIYSDRPWLIVDGDELARTVEAAGGFDPRTGPTPTALWVKGDPSSIRRSLTSAGFVPEDILTAQDVLERPAFVSTSRTFRLLRALGLAAAALVVLGIVLYLQARLRSRMVSYALARRMGLRPAAHVGAVAIELGAMLCAAALSGLVLGTAVAWLLYSVVDPLPEMAPDPLLRLPALLPVVVVPFLAAVTAVGAFAAHVSAARANVAQELRRAE